MSRRRKVEVLSPQSLAYQHRTQQRLDTIGAVRREMGRLFRAAANGRIPSDEMARLIYGLKEIRACLEAEPPPPEISGPIVDVISITGIPSGWSVTALFGAEAHMPRETLLQLKALLPPDAFAPIPELFLPPPIEDTPVVSVRPFLRVHDGDESVDPELPPAA